MLRNLLLIIIFVISVYSTCRKNAPCNQITHNFKTNIAATPGIDSIPVNDTLWLKIDESTQLYDYISNTTVDFSTAKNLTYVFGIHAVISPTNFQPAADSFHYVIKKGQYAGSLNPAYLREYLLLEEASRYKLEAGFVTKKKGIYRVGVENSANVYTRDKPCIKAGFSIKFSNVDQHFYLGYNISGEQVYYFKVY